MRMLAGTSGYSYKKLLSLYPDKLFASAMLRLA